MSRAHCILPPNILRSIAERGTEQQRRAALRTLAIDQTFRSMRAASAVVRRDTPSFPGPGTLVGPPKKNVSVYDADHQQDLPGTLRRAEGAKATGDSAVDQAYDGLGSTFRFYLDVFQRNSIDDEGLALLATVHFGQDYNNAFWNGQQMVFGDGDGEILHDFTGALDVIGHELTHGVTEDEAKLQYLGQSGALNESISDVFGSLVKQFVAKQTADKADWLVGEGLFTSKVKGVALRSMKAPGTAFDDPVLGKDPQPDHMSGYVHTLEDNGGVHINSGIPNRAFYLTAVAIGGYAWEKAGHIWYETLRDPGLKPSTQFRRFASLTIANAGRLFGQGGAAQVAVAKAWTTVGITLAVPEGQHAGAV